MGFARCARAESALSSWRAADSNFPGLFGDRGALAGDRSCDGEESGSFFFNRGFVTKFEEFREYL